MPEWHSVSRLYVFAILVFSLQMQADKENCFEEETRCVLLGLQMGQYPSEALGAPDLQVYLKVILRAQDQQMICAVIM